MYYLKSVTFDKDFRCFKKGEKIEFFPGITLLVGEQRTGKSSLIYAIQKNKDVSLECDKIEYYIFDTEKDNPRIKSHLDNKMLKFQVSSLYTSHGDTIKSIVVDKISNHKKPCLFIIDEPESGLSLKSQYKLAKTIIQAMKKKQQIIIATHSYILMKHFPNFLIDMETRKPIIFKDFLKKQIID